jgi:hypothetical protein
MKEMFISVISGQSSASVVALFFSNTIRRDGKRSSREHIKCRRGASMKHQGVDLVEIFSHLEPGDRIAVRETDELRAGAKVNVKQSSLAK